MTPDEIDIEIQTYLESLLLDSSFSSITRHSYEGITIDVEPNPQTDVWVLFSIRINNTYQVEIGGKEALGIREGNLHINVFTPKMSGKILGASLAGEFENDLRKRSLDNCLFQEPNTSFIATDDWFNHHTIIPFYTTIGE